MRGFISPAGEVHDFSGPAAPEYAHHVFAGAQLGMSREEVEDQIIRNFDPDSEQDLYREIYRRGWLRLQDAYTYPGLDRPRTLVLTGAAAALTGPAWEALLGVLQRESIRRVDMELHGEDGRETYHSLDVAQFRARNWAAPAAPPAEAFEGPDQEE